MLKEIAIYLLIGIALRQVLGYKGLLETLTWPVVVLLMALVWMTGGWRDDD